MIQLKQNEGIPRTVILLMAVVAGLSVANIYYNQPLLGLMQVDLHVTVVEANLITVITQVGYAIGLFLIIPLGDLLSRRAIIMTSMTVASVMALLIALVSNVWLVWVASFFLGACSVIPQLFIPIAGQFSKPNDKARNMGYVLSGLLTGILAARVVSGFIGHLWGWRAMYVIAAIIMAVNLKLCYDMMPTMATNFKGTYWGLMRSIYRIFVEHPRIRLNSVRAAFAFGSLLAIWACLAFHLAGAPFYDGSDMVGMLGLCGICGALVASKLGKYVPRYGIWRFSIVGALIQILAWVTAWVLGFTYFGLIIAIILEDIGLQCQQLSNQSGVIAELPEASNRVNTIFMTTYFIGGSVGSFLAGIGWSMIGWAGVCIVGLLMAGSSLVISLVARH
jgi:predicted MFS family arabinose efflux permease